LTELVFRGRREGQAGFTIIELMVVMSLIVVLATIGLAQYRTSVVRAKEAVLKEDLFRMRDAIDQYYADKNKYPPALEDLVTDGYLRQIPKDPITDSASTWHATPAEPDPNNPISDPGIFDVKSGSDATALDGTRYAEW
jgi:general secretion pathway protein G